MINSILLITALLLGNGGDAEPKSYAIDTEASSVEWYAEKVTGKHNGVVNLKEGSFTFSDGKLTGGTFTADMTSLESTDLQGEWKQKLDGHLKSDDFFGVEKFPTSKFVIKSVAPQGPGKYKITGDFTIKGITNEVKFTADLKEEGEGLVGSAEVILDRAEYNIKYGSGSFFDDLGDKTIYDEFKLVINVVAAPTKLVTQE